ncbi:MAG: hypothetical protein ACK56I_08665, partial [bacterium]
LPESRHSNRPLAAKETTVEGCDHEQHPGFSIHETHEQDDVRGSIGAAVYADPESDVAQVRSPVRHQPASRRQRHLKHVDIRGETVR